MAEGILLCIAEEVLKNLASNALDEIALAWGFKARLDELSKTINSIKNVLLDAEERQVESRAIRGWLERLATAIYAADDLFDEVATVASRKQLLRGNKLSKEVCAFFSRSNQIVFGFNTSQKIEAIRKDLNAIVKDSTEFAFAVSPCEGGSVLKARKGGGQTYSYVVEDEVIGRDGDKDAILDILLSSNSTTDDHGVLPVIPIVGIGGLGKTTLAQLIYNDSQVENYFELRLWVCIAEVLDIKGIIEKILRSATNAETPKLEIEQLQVRLREAIGNKKYLLVMDDVWDENRDQWLKLRDLLMGRKGSKILVTTRSREVAKITGTVPLYELQGLSEESSWDLFEKMAFEPGEAQQKPDLVEVGKEIVKKCANVPLAIRTLGSLLYGKDKRKWLSIKDTNLANIPQDQCNIMSILKLSYHHLWSPLKNCFAYCSLFPKDYEFETEALKDLWMAEGFIIPTSHEKQSLDELAEEYFLTLLQRCFFQDMVKDEWGAIISCKMHDLLHDLAQEVAGFNFNVAKIGERKLDDRIRHMSFDYRLNSEWKIPSSMFKLKHLRTFLLPTQQKDGSPFNKFVCQGLISAFRCLRVLDIHNLGVKSLPNSVGELIHLRYLDISMTPINELPDSITKLHNLQTLKLYSCLRLKRLPTDIRKLTNLRSLDVGECHNLTHMPLGIGELISLHKLPRFTVNRSSKFKEKPTSANLNDLKNLNNLRGALWINIRGNLKDPVFQAKEANFTSKHGLNELRIVFAKGGNYEDVSGIDLDEAVLEGLKPHPNLRKLEIYWYRGQKLPSWAMTDELCINLPNLVEVTLLRCDRCQKVPSFSTLPFLKRLSLVSLQTVEYMEVESSVHGLSFPSNKTLFFPFLEELTLMDMDNLKGWWKEANANSVTTEVSHQLLKHCVSKSLSKLSILRIQECPNLISLPLCPYVEDLTLLGTNKTISVSKITTPLPSTSSFSVRSSSMLKKLTIGDVEELVSLPKECLHQLSSLDVQDTKLVSIDRLGEVFATLSSSLRCLHFTHCESLKSISRGMEHLTALEKLVLWNCEQLDQLEEDSNMRWNAFKSRLRSLQFHMIPKMVRLPSGLQQLTSLRSLEIRHSEELTELPEWINSLQSLEFLELRSCHKLSFLPESVRQLTTLNQLLIEDCPGLTKRCRGPTGTDWPNIQHIPLVTVLESYLD